MARLQFKFFVFIFCLVKFSLSAEYDLIADRIECIISPKDLCINTHCASRPIKRYLSYIDIGCHLLESVNNIKIRATLYYKFAEYRKFLIDMEENICDYLNHKKPTQLINVILPQVFNASNIRSCPLNKGDVIIKDLNINGDHYPPGLPAGQYRLDIFIMSEGRPIITVKLFLTAKPKGTAKLEMG